MTNPTQTQPVALAVGLAILLNAVVLIVGSRAGLGDGEIVAVQAGITAIAGAYAHRQVFAPATVDKLTAPKKAAKKRG